MIVDTEPRRDPENIEQAYLQQYLAKLSGSVLDIGCGNGRLTRSLAGNARHIVGIDLDIEELQIAQKTLGKADSKKVCFTAAQGELMSFAKEVFSQAIFSWSL